MQNICTNVFADNFERMLIKLTKLRAPLVLFAERIPRLTHKNRKVSVFNCFLGFLLIKLSESRELIM